MSSSTSTRETESWVQQEGWNPCPDCGIDLAETVRERGPVAVCFEPYHGLMPMFGACIAANGELAVLELPPAPDDDNMAHWFPVDEACVIVVPEVFVRPQ